MRQKTTVIVRQSHKNALQESMGRVIRKATQNQHAEYYAQYFVRTYLMALGRREKRSCYESQIRWIIKNLESAMASFKYDIKIDLRELKETYSGLCTYHGFDVGDLYGILFDLYSESEKKAKELAA